MVSELHRQIDLFVCRFVLEKQNEKKYRTETNNEGRKHGCRISERVRRGSDDVIDKFRTCLVCQYRFELLLSENPQGLFCGKSVTKTNEGEEYDGNIT